MQTIKSIKKDKRVEDVDVESDGTIVVLLKNGFCFNEPGLHCFGEDTPEEAFKSLKRVENCYCDDCRMGEVKWS